MLNFVCVFLDRILAWFLHWQVVVHWETGGGTIYRLANGVTLTEGGTNYVMSYIRRFWSKSRAMAYVNCSPDVSFRSCDDEKKIIHAFNGQLGD